MQWLSAVLLLAICTACRKEQVVVRSEPSAPAARLERSPVFREDEAIGTRAPFAFVEADPNKRWVVLCQARQDTDRNGMLHVHESLAGDRLEPYLVVGTGPGVPIDYYLGSAEDGRVVAYLRGGRFYQVDTETRRITEFAVVSRALTDELKRRFEGPRRHHFTCKRGPARGPVSKAFLRAQDGSWLTARAWGAGTVGALAEAIESHLNLDWDVPPQLFGPLYWVPDAHRDDRLGDPPRETPRSEPASCMPYVGQVEAAELPAYFSRPLPKDSTYDDGLGPPRHDVLLRLCSKTGHAWQNLVHSIENHGSRNETPKLAAWLRGCERTCTAGPDHCWTSCDLGALLLQENAPLSEEISERAELRRQALGLLASCPERDRAHRLVQASGVSVNEYLSWLRQVPASARVIDAFAARALRRHVQELRATTEEDEYQQRVYSAQRLFEELAASTDQRIVPLLLQADDSLRFAALHWELFRAFQRSPHVALRNRYRQRCVAGCDEASPPTPLNVPAPTATGPTLEETLGEHARQDWTEARAWEAGLSVKVRALLAAKGASLAVRAFPTREAAIEFLQRAGLSTRQTADGGTLTDLLSADQVIRIRGIHSREDRRAPDQILLQTLLSPVSPFRDVRIESLFRSGRGEWAEKAPPPGLIAYFSGQRAIATPELIAREWLTFSETRLGGKQVPVGTLLYRAAIGFLNTIARAQGLEQRFALISQDFRELTLLMAPASALCALRDQGLLLERPWSDDDF